MRTKSNFGRVSFAEDFERGEKNADGQSGAVGATPRERPAIIRSSLP